MEFQSATIQYVLKAAHGEIIGKIRLQKIFYFLDQLGLGSGLKFSYHHYGPYAEELSETVDYAVVRKEIIEEKIRYMDGFYSKFRLGDIELSDVPKVVNMNRDDLSNHVNTLKAENSSVLEIAATIHWLQEKEKLADWKPELVARKPSKATPERIESALHLLKRLNLLQ